MSECKDSIAEEIAQYHSASLKEMRRDRWIYTIVVFLSTFTIGCLLSLSASTIAWLLLKRP